MAKVQSHCMELKMPRFKHITGIGKVQFTPDEEKARDTEEAQAKIEAKEYLKVKYRDDRAVSYPPLAEQMDLLYHGGVDALKVELKKTKDKFPKP